MCLRIREEYGMELVKQNGSSNCSWPNVTNPGDGKSSSSRAEQVCPCVEGRLYS